MTKTRWALTALVVLLTGAGIGTQMLGGSASASNSPTGESQAAPEPRYPFQSVSVPTGPDLAVGEVERIAIAAASRAGEDQPTVSIAEGTLEEAMQRIDPSTKFPDASPGRQLMLGEPVFLVTMRGHFTLDDAHVRKGDPPPTGDVLDLVIEAHTGEIVGRALPAENAPVGPALASVASTAGSQNGVLAGVVLLSGGPKPRLGQVSPYRAIGYKVLVRRRAAVVKTARTTKRGFTVSLPPGRYTVTGTQGICKSVQAVIERGRTTHVTLKCSIR